MTLLYWLKHPTAKPPVAESADARLDEVERRLDEVRQRRLQLELDNFRRRS
jgi:F0F1-type ATP synthase membrane subunit b/b'